MLKEKKEHQKAKRVHGWIIWEHVRANVRWHALKGDLGHDAQSKVLDGSAAKHDCEPRDRIYDIALKTALYAEKGP